MKRQDEMLMRMQKTEEDIRQEKTGEDRRHTKCKHNNNGVV
jgi:hypothetical protein